MWASNLFRPEIFYIFHINDTLDSRSYSKAILSGNWMVLWVNSELTRFLVTCEISAIDSLIIKCNIGRHMVLLPASSKHLHPLITRPYPMSEVTTVTCMPIEFALLILYFIITKYPFSKLMHEHLVAYFIWYWWGSNIPKNYFAIFSFSNWKKIFSLEDTMH